MTKTVLVVDDSGTVRQQVSLALKQAGFDHPRGADGAEGSRHERQPRIAMVVCDVNMPNMNGLEMVERLKSRPEHKGLPILMLTTEGSPRWSSAPSRRARWAGS